MGLANFASKHGATVVREYSTEAKCSCICGPSLGYKRAQLQLPDGRKRRAFCLRGKWRWA